MSALTARINKPSLPEAVLFGLILLACSGDYSRELSIGGFSGLGAFSFGAACAVWMIWLLRPMLPTDLLPVFLPLIFFVFDAMVTLFWYSPGKDGVQLLVIVLTFLGTLMLTVRETSARPALAMQLRFALLLTSAIPVFAWLVLQLGHFIPATDGNATRGFALYAMIIAATALGVWREYVWPERVRGQPVPRRRGNWKSLWPLAYVCLIAFVVLLGMSRTALVAIAVLVPLSLVYRGSFKSLLQATVMMAIGTGISAAVLFNYQPLYDRFFKEDASIHVGGVAINATGRTKIWAGLLNNVGDDWILGKGVSSSEDYVNQMVRNVGQPHNDYIRFYYDQGAVGLALWFWFIAAFVYRTVGNMYRSIRARSFDYPYHLSALLALTAVSFSMLTDNSYCYAFVMFPLAIVMGTSLGLGREQTMRAFEAVNLQSAYAPS